MQEFQSEIDFLTRSMPHAAWVDRRAGIFPRNKGQLALEESVLLLSVARVVLHGARGSLESQIKLLTTSDILAPRSRAPISVVPSRVKTQVARTDLEFSNSFGGFVNNGHAYQIDVGLKQLPPMPWSNVVANKKFGFLITELGGGYTLSLIHI